jgi:6-pyruvoyltetrahydropterin/6-carboxytetrahydropterin synthase
MGRIMFKIIKEVKFSAGHFLTGVPADHPCSRQHGHNYIVNIELISNKLDDNGFIIDFNEIKSLIKNKMDHVNLNDVMDRNPTAENIALDIMEMTTQLLKSRNLFDVAVRSVGVKETDTGYAEVFVR